MAVGTVDVDAFWKNGYTIVRNVYTPAEIEAFRQAATASKADGPRDLLSNPRLRSVLTDGNFIEIARRILSATEIWYTGDSSFTINSGQRGFHKDNTDRRDGKAPDWQNDPYTVLRFGVYLQDHLKHSGGLNLRSKSHNVVPLTKGKNTYVRTGVGDVAVWSLRTTHSGNGVLLRWPRNETVEPTEIEKTSKWRIRRSATSDRMALFAALGLDDAHHHRYVDYLKTRTYMINAFRGSEYDEETLAEADKAGLNVRNLPREIEGDDTVGQKVNWEPFPYAGMETKSK